MAPQKGAESVSTFTLAMKMIRFDDLQLFVRTAALGSFSQAAREADLLPGQVAAAVARLERELDLRLFVRTTRSLRLTGEATNLQAIERELTTAPAIDAQRVAAVRESLQNGTYKINPDAIASRMLELDQQLHG